MLSLVGDDEPSVEEVMSRYKVGLWILRDSWLLFELYDLDGSSCCAA